MGRIIKIPNSRPREEPVPRPEKSPYMLDLSEPQKSRTKKCIDIIPPEKEQEEIRIVPEKTTINFFRRSELLRMGSIAVMVVLCLNIGQAFFKAQQVKNEAINAAYAGYEALLEIDPANLEESTGAFDSAIVQFTLAENMIWYLTDSPDSILNSNKYIKTANSLINVGSSVASAGQFFAKFAHEVTTISETLLQEDSEGKPSLTEKLDEAFVDHLIPAYDELKRAEIYLEEVETKAIPKEYRAQVELAQTQLQDLNEILETLTIKFPLILELLGDQYPQKYMILLENNSELRPGGGFIGSFLTLDLNDGYIDDMQFHDIYDWDGAFNEYGQ